MDDFTFRGEHIRTYGAMAAMGSAVRVGAEAERPEYALPDGGYVQIGATRHKRIKRSVTIAPLDGVTPDAAWRRRLLAWLQAGWGTLVLDNDPDVMRTAAFDRAGTWGTREWPDGAITLEMTLEPYAYARTAELAQTETTGGAGEITIRQESALAMPLRIDVEVLSGEVTAIAMTIGGAWLILENLLLTAGQMIHYDAGSMPGDVMELSMGGELIFSHVTRWGRLVANTGDVLGCAVTGGEVRLDVQAIGRWPE